MLNKLNELKNKYSDLVDEINTIKASGNLSKLCNLRTTFDETFDIFFDSKAIRNKYNPNYENNYMSNLELEARLDDVDLISYVEFYKNYIDRLEDELNELKSN